jgi:hypothetical protein
LNIYGLIQHNILEKNKVCYCYKHPLKDELIKDYFELKIAEDELKIAANLDK